MRGGGQVPGVDGDVSQVLADRPRGRELADARFDRALDAFLTPGVQERLLRSVVRAAPIAADQVGIWRTALSARGRSPTGADAGG